jgi:hypothetical protein
MQEVNHKGFISITNSMELSPSQEAASCAAYLELPSI